MRKLILKIFFLCISIGTFAQNPKVKCYFNHPVNNQIATGANAFYLNNTFPDTIAEYINRAKYSVDIVLYNFSSTSTSVVAKLATAVNNAATRGVTVRWIYDGGSSNSGLSLLNNLVDTFSSPISSSYIMHNKFIAIDANSVDSTDAIVITGSYNWTVQQTSTDYNNLLIVQNRQVTLAYYNEFNKMWGGSSSVPNRATATFGTKKTRSAQNIFNVNGTTIEVYFSPKDNVDDQLEKAISTANEDLFFGIYAFTDTNVANLIKTKYNNGVGVKGIMDAFSKTYSAYTILNPVLGTNMITYTGTGLYHSKIMLVDALNPASDPQVFTGSFNWSTAAERSNDENAMIIHDASIANQYYQSLCQNFTENGGTPCIAAPCPGSPTLIASTISGSNYQWQVDTGNGFINISNNTNYSGVTNNNLTITNEPSSWYGYKYRCVVNGNLYSNIYTLKFISYWTGAANTLWENPSNWSCGIVPDANTDVVINNSSSNFPIINSMAFCRSIRLNPNTRCTVNSNFKLTIVR